VVAIRFDGSLYFANIAHFEDAILGAVADHREAKFLLVVGDAINFIDSSGEEMLHNLVSATQSGGGGGRFFRIEETGPRRDAGHRPFRVHRRGQHFCHQGSGPGRHFPAFGRGSEG
jgi:MFS superfamily sulfate permease-like transporter